MTDSPSRSGAFESAVDKRVEQFTESISFDARLFREDIAGSIAHANMLADQQLVSPAERDQIVQCLTERGPRQAYPAHLEKTAVARPGTAIEEERPLTVPCSPSHTMVPEYVDTTGRQLKTVDRPVAPSLPSSASGACTRIFCEFIMPGCGVTAPARL